jgi:DNA ligase-1
MEPRLTRRRFVALSPGLVFGRSSAKAPMSGAPGTLRQGAGRPLMLVQDAPADVDPAGYLVSEKFDGVRAVWDGQQLCFRSGAPMPAPGWFVERLPAQALDGELWLARGQFDALSAIVRKGLPVDADWRRLHYLVFELPDAEGPFSERAHRLRDLARLMAWPQLEAVAQRSVADAGALQAFMAEVLGEGGEGLVLHRAGASYRTGRSPDVLKLKPLQDAEAVVLGHLPGQGKYAGQLGALTVRNEAGQVFAVGSGLPEALRRQPPPPGSVITYRWRGLTSGGLPRFASFVRLHQPGW